MLLSKPVKKKNNKTMRVRLKTGGFLLILIGFSLLGMIPAGLRILSHGPNLAGDAIHYLSMANAFFSGDNYDVSGYFDITSWPPLFPILLALAAKFLSLTPLDVAGAVNLTAFGLTIFVVGKWLSQRLESRFVVMWCLLAIIFSNVINDMVVWAMSEPLFFLFVTLSLYQTDKFLSEGKRASLLWAAIFTCLACMTRYSAVVLVFTVCLLLIIQRNVTFSKKVKHTVIFLPVAMLPLSLWLLKNYLFYGKAISERRLSTTSLLPSVQENIRLSFEVLEGWQIPLIALIALLPYGLFLCWKVQERCNQSFIVVNAGFTFVYFVFIFTMLTILKDGTSLDDRYLSPLFIPLVCVTALILDGLLGYLRKRKTKKRGGGVKKYIAGFRSAVRGSTFSIALITVLSFWIIHTGFDFIDETAENIKRPRSVGAGKFWNQSPIIQYLNAHPTDGDIFSNFPEVVHLFHKMNSSQGKAKPLPVSKDYLEFSVLDRQIEDHDYLVVHYFYNSIWATDYDAAHMRGLPWLEPVIELPNGVIFKKTDKNHSEVIERHRQLYDETISAKATIHLRSKFGFDMYIDTNKNTLTYVKSRSYAKSRCSYADTQAKFFLHIYPKNRDDLSESRRPQGFDNLDFYFYQYGVRFDGKCMAVVPLPEYQISSIRTGQYTNEGPIWERAAIMSLRGMF